MERFQWKFTSYSVNNIGIYRNDNHIAIIDVTARQTVRSDALYLNNFDQHHPPPEKKFLQHTHITY